MAVVPNDGSDAEVEARKLYSIIDISPEVVQTRNRIGSSTLGATIGSKTYSAGTVRVAKGDKLIVRIWESTSDGLFATVDSKTTEFPVTVDSSGEIYIPYVGTLSIAGLSVPQVREMIQDNLEGRAVDPAVSVELEDNGAQSLTISGDVRSAGRFSVPVSGLRLLDAIALAGGAREASYDTVVSVVRDGKTAKARLDRVISDPRNNIWMRPGDTVDLLFQPRSYSALGAISENAKQDFGAGHLSLAEALAQVGGLDDELADRGGVFIFRFENETVIRKLGGNLPAKRYDQGVPTIYRLDFASPEALFLANSFSVEDRDIVYVAIAPTAEFGKFVRIILRPAVTTRNAL